MKPCNQAFFAVLGLLLLAAASHAAQQTRRLYGPPKPMGAGMIWTWIDVDRENIPQAVGVTMSPHALRGLPATAGEACCGGHEYSLPLPSGVQTPFTHVVVNWNPNGHEPAGVYDKPHFDFHFYTMSESDRLAIKQSHTDETDAAAAPPQECLPAGYFKAPGIVGRMGNHWVDPSSPEFNGKPFTQTFIYGSYKGRVSFVEPMITKAVLDSGVDVTCRIPQPTVPIDRSFQPATYTITSDQKSGEISVALHR